MSTEKLETLESRVVTCAIHILAFCHGDSSSGVLLNNHRSVSELWARSLLTIGRGESPNLPDEALVAQCAEIMAGACTMTGIRIAGDQ